jgi:hypothetical protein
LLIDKEIESNVKERQGRWRGEEGKGKGKRKVKG